MVLNRGLFFFRIIIQCSFELCILGIIALLHRILVSFPAAKVGPRGEASCHCGFGEAIKAVSVFDL